MPRVICAFVIAFVLLTTACGGGPVSRHMLFDRRSETPAPFAVELARQGFTPSGQDEREGIKGRFTVTEQGTFIDAESFRLRAVIAPEDQPRLAPGRVYRFYGYYTDYVVMGGKAYRYFVIQAVAE